MRILAVDWSGDARLARSRIWLAEAAVPGSLVRLEAGRDRPEIVEHLLAEPDEVVIGLDFGFSFPIWYLEQLGAGSASELWALATVHGEHWLEACEPPFWGRHGHPRPLLDGAHFRRAEVTAPRSRGIGPKSMFQVGGSGAVGTGSIRGMPLLHRLHAAGATIWPFVRGGWPLVLEIYPRLLTGPLTKSNPSARENLLVERYPELAPAHRRLAIESDDAFDAAVSALVMVEHVADLALLAEEAEADADLRLEGRIWHPAWRSDNP